MNKLFNIKNGNCNVTLFEDGTRIVETIDPEATFIKLEQPLSLDINISNRCSNNCPYCYAGNTSEGKVADLMGMNYLDDVSGIEIAINIQFPLPDHFEEWLLKMKNQNIIVSGTVNQRDFEREPGIVNYLAHLHHEGLLHGIGVSYHYYNEETYDRIKYYLGMRDVVIHTIIGITPIDDITKLLTKGFKILILGYKQKNRGINYFHQVDIDKWVENIDKILNHPFNSVIAFDTTGLNQARIKDKLSEKEWDESFQGDEGSISFYIDAVNKTFNIDSHTNKPAKFIENLSIKDMFQSVKESVNESRTN